MKLSTAHVLDTDQLAFQKKILQGHNDPIVLRNRMNFAPKLQRFSDKIDYNTQTYLQQSIALFERKAREQQQAMNRNTRSSSASKPVSRISVKKAPTSGSLLQKCRIFEPGSQEDTPKPVKQSKQKLKISLDVSQQESPKQPTTPPQPSTSRSKKGPEYRSKRSSTTNDISSPGRSSRSKRNFEEIKIEQTPPQEEPAIKTEPTEAVVTISNDQPSVPLQPPSEPEKAVILDTVVEVPICKEVQGIEKVEHKEMNQTSKEENKDEPQSLSNTTEPITPPFQQIDEKETQTGSEEKEKEIESKVEVEKVEEIKKEPEPIVNNPEQRQEVNKPKTEEKKEQEIIKEEKEERKELEPKQEIKENNQSEKPKEIKSARAEKVELTKPDNSEPLKPQEIIIESGKPTKETVKANNNDVSENLSKSDEIISKRSTDESRGGFSPSASDNQTARVRTRAATITSGIPWDDMMKEIAPVEEPISKASLSRSKKKKSKKKSGKKKRSKATKSKTEDLLENNRQISLLPDIKENQEILIQEEKREVSIENLENSEIQPVKVVEIEENENHGIVDDKPQEINQSQSQEPDSSNLVENQQATEQQEAMGGKEKEKSKISLFSVFASKDKISSPGGKGRKRVKTNNEFKSKFQKLEEFLEKRKSEESKKGGPPGDEAIRKLERMKSEDGKLEKKRFDFPQLTTRSAEKDKKPEDVQSEPTKAEWKKSQEDRIIENLLKLHGGDSHEIKSLSALQEAVETNEFQPAPTPPSISAPILTGNDRARRNSRHKRHQSNGELINLDITFILSRIIIPVCLYSDDHWETKKIRKFEQQVKQHLKEKEMFTEEESNVKTKVNQDAVNHLLILEREQSQERELFNKKIHQKRNAVTEQHINEIKNTNKIFGKEKQQETTKLTSKQIKDDKKTIDDFEKQISVIKKQTKNKGSALLKSGSGNAVPTDGDGTPTEHEIFNTDELIQKLQEAHKAHITKINHKKQLNNVILVQKHQLQALKNRQNLEKKHAQEKQQLERDCLFENLALSQKHLRQKRWTILDDIRSKHNSLRSLQEKKHQLELKQETETQELAYKLFLKQQFNEKQQELNLMQIRKKVLKNNFNENSKKYQKDKNLSKEELRTKLDELKQNYNQEIELMSSSSESVADKNEIQEYELAALHQDQLSDFEDERKRRRDLLILYHQKEKNKLQEELEHEITTIENQLKAQITNFENKQADMKEAFTKANETILTELQQNHWTELTKLQSYHHLHQQDMIKQFQMEIIQSRGGDETELEASQQFTEEVNEVQLELEQQQEAEKLQLEQIHAQEQEELKVKIEEEKKEVMATEIIEDELTLKQEYIKKIANDTGLSEELIASQLDRIGMPSFWF